MITSGEGGWSAWLETHSGGAGGGSTRSLPGIDGCILEPTGLELAALHAGVAYIDIRAPDNSTALLRTRLEHVSISINVNLICNAKR